MTSEVFCAEFPRLWHTGRAGMWEDARRHGLLSVAALLDDFGITGAARRPYEAERRATEIELEGPDGRSAWLRDNKPLVLSKLETLLDGGMTSEEWLLTLNSRVYFWCRRDRLERFLEAYSGVEQDLLTISTQRLLAYAGNRVELAHLNTGATRSPAPWGGRRGPDTFRPIEVFERPPSKVAEVTVVGRLERIERIVERVERVRGQMVQATLFEPTP